MSRRWTTRYRFESATPLVLGRRESVPALRIEGRWVLIALALAAVAGLVAWFSFSPRFYVLEAAVEGAERIPEGEVFAASGLERVHILWADELAAAAQIQEQIPSVKEVEIACGLPAECRITIAERPPVLTWQSGDQLFWVDSVGGFFPAEEPLGEGWTVSGPVPKDEAGCIEQDVLVALEELEQLGVPRGSIGYRIGRGLVLTDSKGWRVILGQGAGMERRLLVYAAVKKHLLEQGIQPRFVDVRFPEAPYYSETNDW